MRTRFTLTALFCLLAPLQASAQLPQPPASAGSSVSIDDVRKNYRVHAGPFYVKPAVLLKELGVDTNVFNLACVQKSYFTFTVTPQADVAVPMARRGLFRVITGLDAVYYAKYSSERSLDPQVSARLEGYAQRLTVFVEESYLN